MLFYTGGTRLSAHIIDHQTQGYVRAQRGGGGCHG